MISAAFFLLGFGLGIITGVCGVVAWIGNLGSAPYLKGNEE